MLSGLPAGQFLDLHETDFLLNKPSFSIIADLIARKGSISVCEVLDPRQERSNDVSRRLRRINRTARFIEEERGTEDLYVGWPFVRGKFLDGTVVHGPLLFFPVQLEQQGKFWKLTRRGDELAFLNPTLVLAYGQFNHVTIPDEVIEKSADDFDKDSLVFRTQLYEWLKESPLEINFNQDLFADKLQFFDKQTAKDLDQLARTGELKLHPEAVLGIFPQAGSFLVPDYDELINNHQLDETDEVTDDLQSSPVSLAAVSTLPERFIHTPLPMDASQEAALRAVKSGQSLVVQGPPGTGKSQLIANLMADAAAAGKRVLLVCQKRAALDVVAERLNEVGMSAFLALVHDFQDDRRSLYAQLAAQIEQIEAYKQQNNNLNAVLLERDFDTESRRIDEAVAELAAFKQALFDTSEGGISPKELYLTSRASDPFIPLNDVYPQFKLPDVDNFIRRLDDYAAYCQRLGSEHAWANRVNFAQFTSSDLQKIKQAITLWRETRLTTDAQTNGLLGEVLALDQVVTWQAHDRELTALLALPDVSNPASFWQLVQYLHRHPSHAALHVDEVYLGELAQSWENALLSPGPEATLASTDLLAFKVLLADARAARSTWTHWNWWLLTNSGKNQVQQTALANGLTLAESDLKTLWIKLEKRIELDVLYQKAAPLLADLSLPDSPASMRLIRKARYVLQRITDLQSLRGLSLLIHLPHPEFIQTITALLAHTSAVAEQRQKAGTYLTNGQLDQVWQDDTYAESLPPVLQQDFDLLVEADRLQNSFSETEQLVVDRLTTHAAGTWSALFLNSLRLTWLDHLERKHPELRSVSSLKLAQTEQTLQQSVQRKQALSRDILLVKLREQTYRNLTLNRLNNRVTYRDLLHQTTKKRNVWPIRKLMESFADEVFRLVPCWLASPESVSAMFPLRNDLFDLVIFDEASQCFAENGIPAIARGKQIVITGDNQQLRPTDLYRIRLDELSSEDETPAALEVESLLELGAQYLPQVSLTEHYRSRSLDLITFSNKYFYQNKLSLLPHFQEVNDHKPAIHYQNVSGTWHQQTNEAEAEAIVRLLNQLAVKYRDHSVGVVTFNYPQQQLIQDLVETQSLHTQIPQLFVKNIENVQGDERDIIIFSVGYAPDHRGRLSMQFGSLNTQGGENRLNVAITRAREQVYVVTSLWPNELAVEDTLNEGPRVLKAYLQYALDVSQGYFRVTPQQVSVLPSSALLKDKLALTHFNWKPELPFADLTVKDGHTYQSLILTDDEAYFQQSLKQAHAYLPITLTSRHWPFQRIWSREYWRNPTN
ncbi:hypothetical protein GCM10027577_52010 [Spirosoma fluminis]